MSQFIAEANRRLLLAEEIVVDHPRMREAHNSFDRMRACTAGRSRRETTGLLMVAPSQSGKSTIFKVYRDKENTAEAWADGRIPVLVVKLQANQTRKGLAQDILKAFENYGFETGWKSGTEGTLLDRVQTYIKAMQTEILFLDEFHHLVHSESQRVAISVAETIKWLLIEAIVPVVMSGTEDAWRPIKASHQLALRCEAPLIMDKLDLAKPDERDLFGNFLARYLVEFERLKLATNATALLNAGRTGFQIHQVSDGVLGRACNLLKEALYLAVIDGRDEIGLDDLAVATERKFVLNKIITENPFTSAPTAVAPSRRVA